jgi:hypothetical protein
MNKRIETYKELIGEKQKLEVLLKAQKELVRYDVQELKLQLKPISDAVDTIQKFITRDKTEILLNIGSDVAVNTLVKKLLLGRAGWLTRLIIPYFLSNYTSNFLAEQKDKWLEKLSHWLSRNRNGKEKHKEHEEEQPSED